MRGRAYRRLDAPVPVPSMELQDGGTQLRQLVNQLVGKDGNGAHVVPDVEVRAVVALLSLAVRKANPKVELNAFVLGTVDFAVEAKVVPDDPPDALTRKLEKHLIGLLSTQLRTRLETFFREELAQGGADMTRQVAAKSQTAGRAPPQQQPRPWGSWSP